MANLFLRIQYLVLFITVLCFLPLSIAGLAFNLACLVLTPSNKIRRRIRSNRVFTPKNILITGGDTSAGLRVARAFYQSGHNVIGVKSGNAVMSSPANLSKAFHKWLELYVGPVEDEATSYANELLRIVRKERIDVWISCATGSSLLIDTQARALIDQMSSCACFVPTPEQMNQISNPRKLLELAQGLGMPVPETHQVKSRGDIHDVLNESRGKRRYTLKSPEDANATWPRAVFPKRTLSQTYHDVARLKISSSTPWLLRQYIEGLDRYDVLCVIAHGQIVAFAACSADSNSTGNRHGLKAMDTNTPLHGALLRLTKTLVKGIESDLSSHLHLQFCVYQQPTDSGLETKVLVLNGNTCANETLTLFRNIHGSIDLSRAYLKILGSPQAGRNGVSNQLALKSSQEEIHEIALPTSGTKDVYSLGSDVVRLLLQPTWQVMRLKLNLRTYGSDVLEFARHVIWQKDNIYEFWDPLPFWWSYQVSLPTWLALASMLELKQRKVWTGP